jgi:hypothetical protein
LQHPREELFLKFNWWTFIKKWIWLSGIEVCACPTESLPPGLPWWILISTPPETPVLPFEPLSIRLWCYNRQFVSQRFSQSFMFIEKCTRFRVIAGITTTLSETEMMHPRSRGNTKSDTLQGWRHTEIDAADATRIPTDREAMERRNKTKTIKSKDRSDQRRTRSKRTTRKSRKKEKAMGRLSIDQERGY